MLDIDSTAVVPPQAGGSSPGESIRRFGLTGGPLVLAIRGHGELTVRDPASLQQLIDLVDRLEQIDEVRDRLRELDEGKPGLSLEQAKEHARQKYGISV